MARPRKREIRAGMKVLFGKRQNILSRTCTAKKLKIVAFLLQVQCSGVSTKEAEAFLIFWGSPMKVQ